MSQGISFRSSVKLIPMTLLHDKASQYISQMKSTGHLVESYLHIRMLASTSLYATNEVIKQSFAIKRQHKPSRVTCRTKKKAANCESVKIDTTNTHRAKEGERERASSSEMITPTSLAVYWVARQSS